MLEESKTLKTATAVRKDMKVGFVSGLLDCSTTGGLIGEGRDLDHCISSCPFSKCQSHLAFRHDERHTDTGAQSLARNSWRLPDEHTPPAPRNRSVTAHLIKFQCLKFLSITSDFPPPPPPPPPSSSFIASPPSRHSIITSQAEREGVCLFVWKVRFIC